MCEGSASIAVNRDRVEGACNEHEVLPVGLLTRPRSDRSRSCEWVTVPIPPSFPTGFCLTSGLISPYCISPYFTFFTSVHLLISHLSPVPPIFPSVRLCYPDSLRTCMFHPYLLYSTRIVFKISSLYSVSSESTLLFSASFCLSLLNLFFSSHL